ncbi:sensor histidine kinase [Neogemmobacter tilapiae]|uniref:histidine kinase n=1 Tax=Neogemmobacter tilapiae TaxID=875041 RepID=A0A918TR97_9RHOB|nr:PAS-domain containing protein [Gemmobacter tilapiae]GHC58598.1 hybrid sensor histidine kinase/response regulator [Gemmobacter tilapiae]
MIITDGLINPADSAERTTAKLLTIIGALMRRVEQVTDDGGVAYAQFQRAAMLEDQVSRRTQELEQAMSMLNRTNSRLAQAMDEAEGARRNLANAIEAVAEGFALFDPDEVLVMCNSRFGATLADLRPALVPGLRFDDYVDLVSHSPSLVLPEGETPQGWAVRRRQRHQDRHVIFNVQMSGDRWVQISEHRTPDGGTVILQTDVTDLIRLERQERTRLLDSQAGMIRATLEHLSQGVCIFDGSGRLIGWNARLGELLGVPAHWLRLGLEFANLLARLREDGRFAVNLPGGTLRGWAAQPQGRPALEFEVRRGEGIILSGFGQEMPDGGFVLSFTDVSAERAAKDALARANETLEARVTERTLELEDALSHAERANASRSRFVAAASHDLLQPLSAAKLFLASAMDGPLDAPARMALNKAQNALESVDGLLGALLDISRLEAGPLAVNVGPVRLNRVIDPLRDEFAAFAAAKGLRFVLGDSTAVVLSDAGYLRRILQNLIGNAIRYTDQGSVMVSARRRGGMLRIEVRDTGPGIPESEQDNIFKEFHRLHAPASAAEGMGLGLAIVERACAALGHPLELQSAPGQGTCFSVLLALAEGRNTKVT